MGYSISSTSIKSATTKILKISLKMVVFSAIPLILFVLVGCSPRFAEITEENDMVLGSRRIKWTKTYFRAIESNQAGYHPFVNLAQTIMKEIRPNAEATYTVFDVLTMENNQFHVDEKVYLVIDSLPIELQINSNEHENTRTISEISETCDSTNKKIITGYSDIQQKVTRFQYELTPEIVEKIKNAKQIFFRYYSGPTMITFTPSQDDLDSLKMVLNAN